MTFGQAIKSGFSNLTNFKGRARRSEFWWFFLFMTLVSIPLSFLAAIPMFAAIGSVGSTAGQTLTDDEAATLFGGFLVTFLLSLVLSAIIFFLLLAVWVRRLHDAGYSGHWLWLSLIGLSIIPLIFAILEGQRQVNEWGADPKAGEVAAWPPAQPVYGNPAVTPPPYVPPASAPTTYVPPAAPAAPAAPPAPASADATDPFAAPPPQS